MNRYIKLDEYYHNDTLYVVYCDLYNYKLIIDNGNEQKHYTYEDGYDKDGNYYTMWLDERGVMNYIVTEKIISSLPKCSLSEIVK